ncbi:melanoma-associated antigen B16-like [Talpa occidentalis]|uniref:melanoma-associated antigen B16-like n=1 Tax=Talpa occidentalis TaxID=50954 RepID=UPI00188F2794|nr:melanoma-associated antigen B16-like [Talpa occidentalis]XP_037368992.1 melanoma-associated antigen B16-like [Talpa occidentalis]XP_037368993.1 melanoma-associated antigen B16-like [Talpa occidentalis]XP_054551920.1 melanoma-associated antigen B16-like [Talpa occidentalis]
MPWHQKSPRFSHHLCPEARSNVQSLEIAQITKALEETSLSSHPLMPANRKEAPEAGMASIPEGPQSVSFSGTASMSTSSSKSEEGSTSQAKESSSTSLAEPDAKNALIYPLEEKVAILVNFMLFKYQVKQPITKADMLNTVIKEYEYYFTEILLRAMERMEMIFGLDVQEVDPINHCYVLLIKAGLTYDGLMSGEEGVPKTGILILVLGVIFMKGNHATEEEVWEVLSLMGIYPGVKHFIFGDPREIIKDFVKENYLVYQQVATRNPVQLEFLWGPRAHAETTKMKVLEFLAKVNRTEPSNFSSQYEEALKDEEERARGNISASAEFPFMATAKFTSSFHT